MEQKTSSFDRVLGAWDILVIAFGAMIGWGWGVSTGTWIQDGGILGAALGFVIGGIMIFFVRLTYAELTSAMPQCGGEHVFSHRAMGPIGSFICTWAIVLGYASVVCFEACALPTIITYIFPDFLQGYLYTVAGFKIYASWLAVAVGMSLLMTWINIRGVKAAAKLQTILTVIIGAAGILLIVASAITGSVSTLAPQAFVGEDTGMTIKAVLAVAVMTPFYFIGFDVIPQAAEEIKVPLKKIGSILILSVVCAVLFYALVIVAVGLVLTGPEILASENGTGLVTADAMAKAMNSATMGHHHRRHHHELELLPHGRQPCTLLHGGVLHGAEVLREAPSAVQDAGQRALRHPKFRRDARLAGVAHGRRLGCARRHLRRRLQAQVQRALRPARRYHLERGCSGLAVERRGDLGRTRPRHRRCHRQDPCRAQPDASTISLIIEWNKIEGELRP